MRHVLHGMIAGAMFAAGFVGHVAVTHAGDATLRRADELTIVEVYCPQEDTCHLEYDNGRWSVRRLAPSQI